MHAWWYAISCGDFACSYHATFVCNILVVKRLHVWIHVYKGKSLQILGLLSWARLRFSETFYGSHFCGPGMLLCLSGPLKPGICPRLSGQPKHWAVTSPLLNRVYSFRFSNYGKILTSDLLKFLHILKEKTIFSILFTHFWKTLYISLSIF